MRFFHRGHRDDEALPVGAEPVERIESVGSPEPLEPVGPAEPVASAELAEPSAEPVASGEPAAPSAPSEEPAEPAPSEEPAEPTPPTPELASVEAELAGGDPDVAPGDKPATAEDADRLASAEAAADTAIGAADAATPDAGTTPETPGGDDEPSFTAPAAGRVLFWPEPSAEAAGDQAAEDRPPALRFAGLHLRGGQYALARAELEALAGRGRLDESALLDLAEVRWRTGDLAGAGEAANALLARGSDSPLALVIAAEAVAAVGRPGEARRLSSRALEVPDVQLDELFAGIPRSTIWPAAPASEPPGVPRRRGGAGDASRAPSTASEAFAGGRAALARGDQTRAALLLSVAMRLAPEFAEDVLHAVAGRDDHPLLALVRGDALRLLGQETEALEAFDRARGRASSPASGSQHRVDGPGLFDDDPAMSGDEEA